MSVSKPEITDGADSFEGHFSSSLRKAAESCDIALSDILAARREDGRVDTKTLRDITAALKDLNGLGGEKGGAQTSVLFSSEAERYGV